MAKAQRVTEGDILKGFLKQRRMTQQQLSDLIGYGRTKLNLALGMAVLDDELKAKVIEVMQLPADAFPERPAEEEALPPSTFFADLSEKVDKILAQQQEILALLKPRS